MDNAGPGLRTSEVGSLFDGGEEMIDVVQRHAECEAQITCNNAHGTPRTLSKGTALRSYIFIFTLHLETLLSIFVDDKYC